MTKRSRTGRPASALASGSPSARRSLPTTSAGQRASTRFVATAVTSIGVQEWFFKTHSRRSRFTARMPRSSQGSTVSALGANAVTPLVWLRRLGG